MKKMVILSATILCFNLVLHAQKWNIDADYAESCECNVPCPCIVGLEPTNRNCVGNSIVMINKGNYGDVNVDGLKLFITFSLGEWAKVYVDEKASQAQADAIVNILHQPRTVAFFFHNDSIDIQRAHITVAKTDSTFTYSVPDSYAQIKYLLGKDGKTINLQNLEGNFLTNNKLAQSVDLHHTGDARAFQLSGTHGLTSHFTASGEIKKEEKKEKTE